MTSKVEEYLAKILNFEKILTGIMTFVLYVLGQQFLQEGVINYDAIILVVIFFIIWTSLRLINKYFFKEEGEKPNVG